MKLGIAAFRIIETNAWKALAVMILRAVFAVCCVARLAVAPYSSLVRTEVSVEHVEILRALHEKNEEALDLYWGGDAASALAVLKSAFSPSEVAPIGMWKTYAWILRSKNMETEASIARKTIRSISSFLALLQLQDSMIPLESAIAKTSLSAYNESDDSYRATWVSPSSFGKSGQRLVANLRFTRSSKDFMRAAVSAIVPDDRLGILLPGNYESLGLTFRTIYELDFKAMLCEYPLMQGEPPPMGAPLHEWKYLDMMKKSVTGYLAGESFVKNPIWDIPFSNIYSLNNWNSTPPSVLTATHVGSLNAMQEIVREVFYHNIPGDIVEAGVFRGGMSIFLASLLDLYDGDEKQKNASGARRLWCADTFSGIPERLQSEASEVEVKSDPTLHWQKNAYSASLQSVTSRFKRYNLLSENVGFVVGKFSETFGHFSIGGISVLRIDCDTYIGTIQTLRYLYKKVPPGGFVIVDDFHLAGARNAVLEFRSFQNVSSPLLPVPIDYVNCCDPMKPKKNTERMKTFIEDILYQRGENSKINRIISPQAVYWRVGQ